MLNDQMRADDIVQEVFTKLFENLKNIRNKQSTQYWLLKTARNEMLAFFRSTKNKKLYSNSVDLQETEIESPDSLIEQIENRELSKIVLSELNLMSLEFREVFILREYSGFSYKEIAALLEIDEDLVKGRLYKARQKLVNKISKLVK